MSATFYPGPGYDPGPGPEYDREEPDFCECGRDVQDCDGGCYPNSLLQLRDPETGESPVPLSVEDPEDDYRIGLLEAEMIENGRRL